MLIDYAESCHVMPGVGEAQHMERLGRRVAHRDGSFFRKHAKPNETPRFQSLPGRRRRPGGARREHDLYSL